MKGVKGIRQILVVRNGDDPPPQYGNIPQREVGSKSWSLFIALFEIRNCQNVLPQLSVKLAEMETYPAFNFPRFLRSLLLVWNLLSRMSQFDLSSNINVRSNYDSMFSSTKWQLFSEMEATVILWRGQRTASCFLTMRHNELER